VILASSITWYSARAGGLVAFALLTASVALGLLLSGRVRNGAWPRFAIEDVHRFAGLLTGVFIGLHGASLLVDSYYPFTLGSLLVPGAAPYRPLATALGIVAAELLVALALTNRFRKRLSYGFWRRAHYLNFAVWLLVLVHGLTAGTDSRTVWGLSYFATAAGLVAGLTLWRIVRVRRPARLAGSTPGATGPAHAS